MVGKVHWLKEVQIAQVTEMVLPKSIEEVSELFQRCFNVCIRGTQIPLVG